MLPPPQGAVTPPPVPAAPHRAAFPGTQCGLPVHSSIPHRVTPDVVYVFYTHKFVYDTETLWGGFCCFPHLADEEPEVRPQVSTATWWQNQDQAGGSTNHDSLHSP